MLPACGLGCASLSPSPGPVTAVENPLFVRAPNVDSLWEPLVDTVDDYFRIANEERVRQVGDILTEGRIDTFPLISGTYLEPWKRDTVTPVERLEATLQSMRRTAVVRVMPTSGGYLVEIQVYKEIEDVAQPEGAAIGVAEVSAAASALSLNRLDNDPIAIPGRLGWIPRGRDFALEQVMLAKLQERLTAVAGPPLGAAPFNAPALPPPPQLPNSP